MALLYVLLVVIVSIYIFLSWNFTHWHRRGVNGPKPWLLLGSYPSLFNQRQHFADDLRDLYTRYRNSDSFIGVFLVRTPQLLLLEPKLIHEVFVSSFAHFEDNDAANMVDVRKDVLVACNPFLLTGNAWREHRSLVSPVLTSVRIRTAFNIMERVCSDLCDYITNSKGDALNGKDLALRFTADNLLDCVLGIQANSFGAQPLPVVEHIQSFSSANPAFMLAAALSGFCPRLLKYYRVKIFPRSCERFFCDIMSEAFQMRRRVQMDRNDFMNHLLELQRQHKLNDLQLTSHAMTFLIDGLDTSAAAIAHCLLLLARNADCQERLHKELIDINPIGLLPNYDQLNELPYLDACLNESLRIYPPGLWAAKTCTRPYILHGGKSKLPLQLDVGDTVMIPIYGLHHDPLIYPDPQHFRPERFLQASDGGGVKSYRNRGVFLGFGDGPRQCLGMRLALVQTKAAISAIVRRFVVHVDSQTTSGYSLDPNVFVAQHKGGVWLNFKPRP